jgi:O-antigen/teichoic acid export membrane protein
MLIRNTVANFAGQLLYPLLALALVPFYLRHVGIEGYGLIGLIAMVVSVLGVFSKGLGSALQREFGRRSATPEGRQSLAKLLRSFEVVYWVLAAVLAAAFAALALTVGAHWIRADTIPQQTVVSCLGLLALRVALAFPHSIYQSVFIGTERQVEGNVLNSLLALASVAANVTAILLFGSVVALYVSEVVTAGVFLIVFRSRAFAVLPPGVRVFDSLEVRSLLRGSADLVWTNGIGLLISTLDRVVVSAVLPIAALGLYAAVAAAARAVGLGLNPFLMAAYPRTCRIAEVGTVLEQRDDLLRAAAIVSAFGAAITLPLSAFSVDVLTFWLRDARLAEAGAPVLTIYGFGSLAIGLATVLYQRQMATGATRFGARFNTIALLWFPCSLWFLVVWFGLTGAALAWLIYALAAWLYHVVVTFRDDALGTSARSAYLRAVTGALVPVAALVAAARFLADKLFQQPGGRLTLMAAAAVISALLGALRFKNERPLRRTDAARTDDRWAAYRRRYRLLRHR